MSNKFEQLGFDEFGNVWSTDKPDAQLGDDFTMRVVLNPNNHDYQAGEFIEPCPNAYINKMEQELKEVLETRVGDISMVLDTKSQLPKSKAGVDHYRTCSRCGKVFQLTSTVDQYNWKKSGKFYCCEKCYMDRSEPKPDVLKRARRIYGNNNQITVAMEELAELIAVLAKYPRYETHVKAIAELRTKALDEAADVYIVLEHVKAIFELSDEDIAKRMNSKLSRLERWLDDSNSFEQTTKDRVV